jgi:antitoxin component YwqK of YwqJK toxin-antitoxin module
MNKTTKVIHEDGSWSIGHQNENGEWDGDVDEYFPNGDFKLRYNFSNGELIFIY